MNFQPIETVPKDGRKVYLIINNDPQKIVVGYWVEQQNKWWLHLLRDTSVRGEYTHTPAPFWPTDRDPYTPTHWLEIPEVIQTIEDPVKGTKRSGWWETLKAQEEKKFIKATGKEIKRLTDKKE